MNYGTTIDDLMTLVMRAEEHAQDTCCESEPMLLPVHVVDAARFQSEVLMGVA